MSIGFGIKPEEVKVTLKDNPAKLRWLDEKVAATVARGDHRVSTTKVISRAKGTVAPSPFLLAAQNPHFIVVKLEVRHSVDISRSTNKDHPIHAHT